MQPKATRFRTKAHDRAVQSAAKRQFAVQENQVEHVEIGSGKDLTATEVLETLSSTEAGLKPVTPKRGERMLKHAKLLEKVEASRLPYSKSHARRLKRKAKEELAGGGLSDIQSAIAAMESNLQASAEETFAEPSKNDPSKPPAKSRNTGLIGEGKGVPLSQTKRKNALKLERMRHSMVIANSHFKANPFQVIRTHAQNTLVKHATPTLPS
ncbi:ribosome biogenesis protein SLX9-domain-containing protein [Thelephora terrestris]|uniref:Ribosome biogenesis protein SLX9 n=1 Tax=Thelephora terrestris TaxID=56493 RepID=A0A9P6HH51_9AGAM|nr:ribosome biogenesis protein SLX9-domain-containing protein [Thelephora terrestris]